MRYLPALVFLACTSTPKEKVIKGSVELGPEMKAPAGSVFVIARKGSGGPPLAVKKLAVGQFPMTFELTEKDVMMGGPFEGDVEVTVRVDQDGDAMTRSTGDLMGKSAGKVTVGDTAVKVVLDQTLP